MACFDQMFFVVGGVVLYWKKRAHKIQLNRRQKYKGVNSEASNRPGGIKHEWEREHVLIVYWFTYMVHVV